MAKTVEPPEGQLYFELTLETRRVGREHHTGRMVVRADTREDAMLGMKNVIEGNISMKEIPKTGLDMRTVPLAPEGEFNFANAERGAVIKKINEDAETTRDLLGLVDFDVPVDVIKKWTADQKRIVDEYAGATHLRASDNKVKVPPMPQFLRDYQMGGK